MKKLCLVLACTLMSAGCVTTAPDAGLPLKPSVQAIVDDRLMVADKAFDLFNDAVNLMIDNKILVPGTPKAKALAYWIRNVDSALNVASHAADVGEAATYSEALSEAQKGITELKKLIRS